MSRERALDKLKKVLELQARATTEGEAAAAALVAQRLMDEHNIHIAELEEAGEAEPEPVEKVRTRWGNTNRGQIARWKTDLFNYVAHANGCEVLYVHFNSSGTGSKYKFGEQLLAVGRKSDVEVVVELVQALEKQINSALKTARYHTAKQHSGIWYGGRNFNNSFRVGCVHAIGDILRDEKNRQEKALVVYDERRKQAQALVRSMDVGSRDDQGMDYLDGEAFRRGSAAAEQVLRKARSRKELT